VSGIWISSEVQPSIIHYNALQVDVTQWLSFKRAQNVSNLHGREIEVARLDQILKRGVRTGWIVENGMCASHRLCLVEVQRLPDPPHPVQHGMVHEEDRVVGAAEEVTSITADRKVAGRVHTEEFVGEATLELVLKGVDALGSFAEGEVVQIGVGEPFSGSSICEVSLRAPWVVGKRRLRGDQPVLRW
jgi:hypothetical protein